MALSRRVIAAVAVAVTVGAGVAGATLLGGGSDGTDADGSGSDVTGDVRTVQPGAPGEAGRELTDEDVAAIDAPGHTAADTAFMQAMVAHHAQAVEMASLVGGRTHSVDMPLLAERITLSQEAEVELLEQWLTDRGEAIPDVEDTVPDNGGDPTDTAVPEDTADHAAHVGMPGMATPEQLAALEAARGPAFDLLFLQLMIAHHEGALTMVEELYEAGGGVETTADDLAREVEADQGMEILRMSDMLTTRGG